MWCKLVCSRLSLIDSWITSYYFYCEVKRFCFCECTLLKNVFFFVMDVQTSRTTCAHRQATPPRSTLSSALWTICFDFRSRWATSSGIMQEETRLMHRWGVEEILLSLSWLVQAALLGEYYFCACPICCLGGVSRRDTTHMQARTHTHARVRTHARTRAHSCAPHRGLQFLYHFKGFFFFFFFFASIYFTRMAR